MAAHKSKNPGGAGFVASNQNTPANDTSTAAGMFELLTRIAVALEQAFQTVLRIWPVVSLACRIRFTRLAMLLRRGAVNENH